MFLYEILLTIIRFVIQYFKKQKEIKEEPKPLPPLPTQFEKLSERYNNFYMKTTDDENSNISEILYDFEKRKEMFADTDNDEEKKWKSRILHETTPRGNVIMYYNPYTLSFYYHSDEQIIPYKILEQVAKKYVVIYRCKDFFIDMVNRPANRLIEILQKEEDALKSKKMKVSDITKCVNAQVTADSKDVFAALKDYRSAPAQTSSTPSVPSSTMITKKVAATTETKFSNKFVRIGKLCEFNILQKPPNKKIAAINELMFGSAPVNKVVDFFDDDDCLDLEIRQEEVVSSYKMFKQQMNKKS
jgi:hypothetical protein